MSATHEEACAALNAELAQMGTISGRRIMGRCVADLLETDQMKVLVDEECASLAEFFRNKGALASDIDVAIGVFRAALIKEGKRIAIGLGTEAGSA